MNKKRGEIATVLAIGTLIVIGITSFISSYFIKNNIQTTSSNAQEIGPQVTCQHNPWKEKSPTNYCWFTDCKKTCVTNEDCPQAPPGYVDPKTSNWCYAFLENGQPVKRCMILVYKDDAKYGECIKGGVPSAGGTGGAGGGSIPPTSTIAPTRPASGGGTATPIPTKTPIPTPTNTLDCIPHGNFCNIGNRICCDQDKYECNIYCDLKPTPTFTPTPTNTPTPAEKPTPSFTPTPKLKSDDIQNCDDIPYKKLKDSVYYVRPDCTVKGEINCVSQYLECIKCRYNFSDNYVCVYKDEIPIVSPPPQSIIVEKPVEIIFTVAKFSCLGFINNNLACQLANLDLNNTWLILLDYGQYINIINFTNIEGDNNAIKLNNLSRGDPISFNRLTFTSTYKMTFSFQCLKDKNIPNKYLWDEKNKKIIDISNIVTFKKCEQI